MCSDPQTQPNKDTGEMMTFACRRCDECIATRRHNWVARAMAEKAEHEYSYVIALTYSDETQAGRDGARMFCYADVSAFLKRLRAAARYEAKVQGWNLVPQIRFLCAGEQGSRNGRCHWHLILYSNVDLARVGKFRRSGVLVTHRRDMISVGKQKRRLNWSLWPYGFMTMQEPDQGGMNYVLSYCLKDQFTYEKSKDSTRVAKSENFATGLFRMSKRPAIGENWLMQKMESLLEKGAVPPSLNLRVPGFHGFWQPSGSFRQKLLWCLVALKKRILWTTGANAPQWSTLLASCSENLADMEILNGPQETLPDALQARLIGYQVNAKCDAEEAAGKAYADDERFYRLSGGQCEALGLRPYQDAQGRIRFACKRGEERGGNDTSRWPEADLSILNRGAPFHERVASNWRERSRQDGQGGKADRPSYMQAAP